MIDSAIDSETAPILAREGFNAVSGFGSVTTAAAITFSSVVAIDEINLRLDLDYNGDSDDVDDAGVRQHDLSAELTHVTKTAGWQPAVSWYGRYAVYTHRPDRYKPELPGVRSPENLQNGSQVLPEDPHPTRKNRTS